MALNETLNLNITEALRQIALLETQLDQLSQPVTIPLNVQSGPGLAQVRQELDSSEGRAAELNRELAETDDLLHSTGREASRTGQELETAGRRGTTAFGNLRTTVGALAGGLVAFAGAQALGRFLGDSITAASELEQSVGALDAVFGELGDEVASFGETADQSVGLAASQFNQLASVLGSQLQTFGFSVEEAARETQNLITLSSDLAATFGGPVAQAVEAISSLLRGEVNPIERYGVAMNEASVQARALEDGLAATASELTFQDKTMARLAILYEQTANAQGQFGREADTTAGQLERLRAEFENTSAEVGEALVPAFGELLTKAQQLLPVIEGLAPVVGLLAEAGLGVVQSFEPILDLFGLLAQPVQDVINALNEVNNIEGDGLENVSASARELFENIDEAIPLLSELQTLISTGFDSASLREFFTDLGNAVAGGTDPLVAAEQALQDFAERGTLTEEVLVAIVETAGLLPGEIQAIVAAAQAGDLGFLTPAELEAIVFGLEDFANVTGGVETRAAQLVDMFERIRNGTQEAAEIIPVSLQEVGSSLTNFINGLEGLDQIGQIEFENPFAELPTGLEAAARAIEDTEGEILDDFGTFLENLEAELAAQRDFADNIATLFELGLDSLGEFFLEAGIESAGLLADGLTDPAELARAEAALDEAARQLAISELDAFVAELEGQLDGVNLEPIPIQIVADLSNFAIPALEAGRIGVPAGSVGGSNVVVNNVYNTPPPPAPDQARAAQITSSIIASNAR